MNARKALLAAALVGGCVIITDNATLTVHNHSSHAVVELRLAYTHDVTWGDNLLGRTMWPSDDAVITDIACGHYDVLAVDINDATCVKNDVHLCGDDHAWEITDLCW